MKVIVLDDGISIPSAYTSYLAPIQSPKLYSEVRGWRDKDKHYLASFETGYVVHLNNKHLLGEPQSLFTYHHPNYGKLTLLPMCSQSRDLVDFSIQHSLGTP